MAKTYNRLNIEINQPINDIMTAVKDDTFSRFLDVFLFSNGTSIDLTEHKVRIYIKKPDGKEIYNQGTITDAPLGRVQFELTNQTLAVCGQLQCQIIIYNNEETQILSTEIFKIMVTQSLICEEAIESTNEYGALVVLFQNIYEALVLIEQVAENTKNCAKETSEYLIENKIKELELQIENVKNSVEISANKIYSNMEEYIGGLHPVDSEKIIFNKSEKCLLQYIRVLIVADSVTNPQESIGIVKIMIDDEIFFNIKVYTAISTDKGFGNNFGIYANVNKNAPHYLLLSPNKKRFIFSKELMNEDSPFFNHSEHRTIIFQRKPSLQIMPQVDSSNSFMTVGCWILEDRPIKVKNNIKIVVTPNSNAKIKADVLAYYQQIDN